MPLKIAICCSNYIFTEGLKNLLEEDSDLQITGLYTSEKHSKEFFEEILGNNPDIILSDMDSYLEIFPLLSDRMIFDQGLAILLIGDTTLQSLADAQLKELIIQGVAGILPQSADSNLLKKAYKAIRDGEVWLDKESLHKIISAMRKPRRKLLLAKREREILTHICQGYRNKEIAQKLNISEQTVKSYSSRLYKKLGVSDRLQLALCSQRFLNL